MSFMHDEYTIAWICALPLEMAAAKAMLDRTHPSLQQSRTDDNSYTLGSIHGHNVAMRATFQNIQLGLMVGIGGGVPSVDADIRLGDVVVSKPAGIYGGVIQYDYGKSIRHGRFQRTGSFNKPPLAFLTTSVHEVIGDVFRPREDQLFSATYDHQDESLGCCRCDESKLITRPPRANNNPRIHYRLITSGDQVMKDATIRDAIAQDLSILCFEMEAAGLMDQLPSLVVRGICDYCDSHKHKNWQAYAALAAAAYARVLLSFVPLGTPHPGV
ncbi:purine and uridine phosphorylase [Aspergillus violaceofuscus CBS 115571]|uniref:Purine and uridine phosphorylase n=1 Tax=Aspergillus violaceofuscus (strain CBS 115571) TaxID=1450538 RepID=A0A2V5I758_ASPV1|nr:purine and uridine phosphorylase [Aspergillus violaceofuscus CBS 115571]